MNKRGNIMNFKLKGKAMKKLTVILALTLFSITTHAKTNVDVEVGKLKENAENSSHNHKQYQTNLDIVERNIKQADEAGKELDRLRTQLEKNVKNVDQNKMALGKLETDIIGFKTAEQEKTKKDDQQLAELKALMEKIENNKKQRLLNIQAYDKKLAEIKNERAQWDKQVQQMADLQKQIGQKKQTAMTEKSNWTKKRSDYSSEADKWKKESDTASKQYEKYSQLAK